MKQDAQVDEAVNAMTKWIVDTIASLQAQIDELKRELDYHKEYGLHIPETGV